MRLVCLVLLVSLGACAGELTPDPDLALDSRLPEAADGEVGVRWDPAGRALVGEQWLGPAGIEALDCEARQDWDAVAEMDPWRTRHGSLPICGAARAHRPLACEPDHDRCLRVTDDAIVFDDGASETRLLGARPEDVRPQSPRNADEVVFHVTQRDESGTPLRDFMRYGAPVLRTYRFRFARGALEELESPLSYPYTSHLEHGLIRTTETDGDCLRREKHERCFPRLVEAIPLPDGALVVMNEAGANAGKALIRLGPTLKEAFRVGGLAAPHGGVHAIARPDGTILVVMTHEALLLDARTGGETARYAMRTEHDSRTHATGEIPSANGARLFSCARDTLMVRDASTGKMERRLERACALDVDVYAEDSASVPRPSPDGRFVGVLCGAQKPCIFRVDDGKRLVLEAGLSAAAIREFFAVD